MDVEEYPRLRVAHLLIAIAALGLAICAVFSV